MLEVNPSNILVIRLGALGDLIQTLPAVRRLHLQWPQAKIHWLVEPKSAPLLQNQSWITPIVFDKSSIFSKNPVRSALAHWRLRRFFRQWSPELCIDYQGLFKSGYATFLSGARYRVGFDRQGTRELAHLFYTHRLHQPERNKRHRSDLYTELSRFAGAVQEPAESEDPYGFEFSTLETKSVRILMHRLRIKPMGYLLFSLGTSRETKRWRDEYWIELVQLCRANYPAVPILLAGHGARDEALARDIYRAIEPGDAVFSAISKTSVREMAMLVRQSLITISPDSMALHLASALQRPAIGIFGGKSLTPQTGSPRGHELSIGLAGEIPCFPCRRNTCDHQTCMVEVPPSRLIKTIEASIPQKYRRRRR